MKLTHCMIEQIDSGLMTFIGAGFLMGSRGSVRLSIGLTDGHMAQPSFFDSSITVAHFCSSSMRRLHTFQKGWAGLEPHLADPEAFQIRFEAGLPLIRESRAVFVVSDFDVEICNVNGAVFRNPRNVEVFPIDQGHWSISPWGDADGPKNVADREGFPSFQEMARHKSQSVVLSC